MSLLQAHPDFLFYVEIAVFRARGFLAQFLPKHPSVMAAIAPASSADLLDLLRKSNILPAERLKALPGADALPPELTKAATVLVQKGFITRFQATQLLAGRHKGFRVGPYVIQDLLGRGGMGAVYLGEHLDLRRKVAIKVLAPGKGEDQTMHAVPRPSRSTTDTDVALLIVGN